MDADCRIPAALDKLMERTGEMPSSLMEREQKPCARRQIVAVMVVHGVISSALAHALLRRQGACQAHGGGRARHIRVVAG
jgi:hypothetical protein